jgi:hypothetical protein
MNPPLRQARLRPQYRDLYPGIPAGVWEVAANLAERLQRRRAAAGLRPGTGVRPMNDLHFEFRGGWRMGPPHAGGRSRWSDPAPDD